MAYEFNADDKISNGYENPFLIENQFLFMAVAIHAAGGIYALLTAKTFMQQRQDGIALAAAFASLIMLGFAVRFAIQALSQLRFIFGRGLPIGLAPELAGDGRGTSRPAQALQQQLRERAIVFQEPKGPLAGVLYSLIRPLLAAPPALQYAAQRQFEGLLGLLGVLTSLVMSYVLFANTPYEGMVSWAYLPLAGFAIFKMFINRDALQTPMDSRLVMLRLIGLVAFAVIGPVLLPRIAPAINLPAMWMVSVCLLVGAIGASCLFFAALVSRIDCALQTAVSCEQTTIALNCQPAQLWTAISRDFQDAWARGIPNRAYVNIPPEANDAKGSFRGDILEEAQPEPTNFVSMTTISQGFKQRHAKYLVLLGFWAIALSGVAVAIASRAAMNFPDMNRFDITASLLTLIALEIATLLSFRLAHFLWSRMYFKSRLTWIEVIGTYQTAELDIGNQIAGNARSRSTVIRVEDATLRVWMTDVVTVAFGKDSSRFIMAMAPVDQQAASIARRLQEFAADQSMVVAPSSPRDIDKTQRLNHLGKIMSNDSYATQALLETMASSVEEQPLGGVPIVQAPQEATVKFYDAAKQFGYLRDLQGTEWRFTAREILPGIATLNQGDKVLFKPASSSKGRQAMHVCRP